MVKPMARKCLLLGHIYLKNNILPGSDPEAGSGSREDGGFIIRLSL